VLLVAWTAAGWAALSIGYDAMRIVVNLTIRELAEHLNGSHPFRQGIYQNRDHVFLALAGAEHRHHEQGIFGQQNLADDLDDIGLRQGPAQIGNLDRGCFVNLAILSAFWE